MNKDNCNKKFDKEGGDNYEKMNIKNNEISPNGIFIIDELRKEEEQRKNNEVVFMNKKRGRRKKSYEDNKQSNENRTHNKFSEDNLKRKIKTHYHNFIIAFLNMKTKKILNKSYKFGKISSDITRNITVEYNLKLFEKKIKEIIVNMSDKYQDKRKNKISLQILLKNGEDDEEINKYLNMNYKDMYLNYYLKSNKETFKGENIDESFETHIKHLEELYGNQYAQKYIENSKNLINIFYKIKKRNRNKKKNILIKPKLFGVNNNKVTNNYMFNTKTENSEKILISTLTQTNMLKDEDEDEDEYEYEYKKYLILK